MTIDNIHPSFNLIDEPWIRVLTLDNEATEVSIQDLFRNAAYYRCLNGEIPTQDFAITRLLLAILYRALLDRLSDDSLSDWQELWEADSLPMDEIDSYLEKYRDCFYLTHPIKPFLQINDFRTSNNKWPSFYRLIADCNDPGSLFSRRDPSLPISAPEAARWLVNCQAYDTGANKQAAEGDPRVKQKGLLRGKKNSRGCGWCGHLGGITIVGNNLKETLLLNFLPDCATDDDAPFWETDILAVGERVGKNSIPKGPVSLLVWPARRICLQRTIDGEFSAVRVTYGDPIDPRYQHNSEFMTRWSYNDRLSKEANIDIYIGQKLDKSRALWRGLSSLLPDAQVAMTQGLNGKVPKELPPKSLEWIQQLVNDQILPSDYLLRISAVSTVYGSNPSVVDSVIHDELIFHSILVSKAHASLRADIKTALRRAEAASETYRSFHEDLLKASGGYRMGNEKERLKQAVGDFYSKIDPLFRSWLYSIDDNTDGESALSEWTEIVRRLVFSLHDEALNQVSHAAWIGRTVKEKNKNVFYDVGVADKTFKYRISNILPQTHYENKSLTKIEALNART